MLDPLRRAVDGLIDLAALAAGAALIGVMTVVVIDVAGRYVGSPLYGAQDIVQMAFTAITFGGMAFCARAGGHISVDLLEKRFSKSVNLGLLVFANLLGALIFALIAWQVVEASKLSTMLNLATNILNLPKAPFQHLIAGFAALTSLTMLLQALILWRAGPADHHPLSGDSAT